MAVKILHKRSAVQFKSATGAQLELGELGLNYHESGPYLQCKDAAGEIVQLGGVYVGASAPSNKLKGAWWLRDSDNTLFLYDGTSWVSIAGGGGGGGGATTVLGGDGIKAVTASGAVTVSVDLATNSHGLSIVGGKLEADIATKTTLGTVKIGQGIDVDAAGEISVDLSGVDVNADLGYTPAVDKGTVTNTAGDDATLPLADSTNAGLFTAAEKAKLAGLPVTVGETPPSTPADGDLWWNSSDDSGRLYVYYDEGPSGSKQWVEASPQGETLTESDADTLYLSKVSDDTAAGAITFEKLTTHKAGIFVPVGSITANGNLSLRSGGLSASPVADASGRLLVRTNNSLIIPKTGLIDSSVTITGTQTSSGTDTHPCGIRSEIRTDDKFDGAGSDLICAYQSRVKANGTGNALDGKYIHYFAPGKRTSDPVITDELHGFRAGIQASDATNAYGFYSGGDAPNYFAGDVNTNGNLNVFETKGAPAYPVTKPAGNGIHVSNSGSINQLFTSGTATSAAQYVCRAGAGAGRFVQYRTSNGPNTTVTESGYIQITGLNTLSYNEGPSDYRLKQNIQPLTSATSKIKQLKPCSFEYTNDVGNEYHGFIAHEVQEVGIPHSWHGTKDATEAIGTLADYDGTELETDVVEPSAEELEYTVEVVDETQPTIEGQEPQMVEVTRTRTWTATGTRPVYQGVDVTKLVPLLTKALQEVIQKNEDLEARIAALEGA